MNKAEFKARMHNYRSALKKALYRSKNEFCAVHSSDNFAKNCLRPRYQPIVSRNVMLYLFNLGGLDAIRHIDQVEIQYK